MKCLACAGNNEPRSIECRICGARLGSGGGWAADATLLDVGEMRVVFGGRHGARLVARDGARPAAAPFARHRAIDPRPPDLRPEATSAVWSLLAGTARAVAVVAEPGAGASTLLAELAATAGAHGFSGGAFTLEGARGPAADIEQELGALIDGSGSSRVYRPSELERIANGRRCLILMDGADLKPGDLGKLSRRFAETRFVVAGPAALSGVPAVELGPLPAPAVLTLLESAGMRCADPDNARAALAMCATAGSLPAAVRRIAAAAREFGRSYISLRLHVGSNAGITAALVAALTPVEARIVAVLALAQAPLAAHQLAYILRDGEIRAALEHLRAAELIRLGNAGTYELARDIAASIPAPEDADAISARIIGVFCDMCDAAPAVPLLDRQVAAAEDLLRRAAAQSQWRHVLALGPRLATLFALRGAFGAWGRALSLLEDGARRADDAPALRRTRHDLGIRAVLLEEHARAVSLLRSVARERRESGDEGGAAVSAAMAERAEQAAAISRAQPASSNPPAESPFTARSSSEAGSAFAAEPSSEAGPTPAAAPSSGAGPASAAAPSSEAGSTTVAASSFAAASISAAGSSSEAGSTSADEPTFAAGSTSAAQSRFRAASTLPPDSTSAAASKPEVTSDRAVTGGSATAADAAPAGAQTPTAAAAPIGASRRRPAGARGFRSAKGRALLLLGSGIAAAVLAAVTFIHGPPAGEEASTPLTLTAPMDAPGGPDVSAPAESRALAPAITAFYANPARIHPGGSTRLCYAVTNAELLRIVPRVGKLTRLRSCQTVVLRDPHRYRYALSAIGADGSAVMRRLHVDVVAEAPPPSTKHAARPVTDPGLTRRAIYQFDATPSVVERGQATSLCVGVERPARGYVTHVGALPPGITRCYRVQPRKTTVYRLYVALEAATTMQTVTVAVRPAGHPHESVAPRR